MHRAAVSREETEPILYLGIVAVRVIGHIDAVALADDASLNGVDGDRPGAALGGCAQGHAGGRVGIVAVDIVGPVGVETVETRGVVVDGQDCELLQGEDCEEDKTNGVEALLLKYHFIFYLLFIRRGNEMAII